MHERAGLAPLPDDLIDLDALLEAYYEVRPDVKVAEQRVSFGTSGHRGSSLDATFNELHILATTQAIVDYRRSVGVKGPVLLGRDTHALSEPAWRTAIEVLAGNGIELLIDADDGFTPTPVLSRAILRLNHAAGAPVSDGILITPSHNPPRDGGFKYNPATGGPAESGATKKIAERANDLLANGLKDVRRIPFERARAVAQGYAFKATYIDELQQVLDLDAVKHAGLKILADPLGGASVAYWSEIADRYDLNLVVQDKGVDSRWAFMPLDHDGKIRMDCSSPWAMTNVVKHVESSTDYQLAIGNDADADRHGIVTRDSGLMNPNHFLAVAISYLSRRRQGWSPSSAVGKTLVSSSIIDRVAAEAGRPLFEVPVGFKYFVSGLLDGGVCFGGEESAGASFLQRDGSPWTTDKDGILMGLLAAEICAVEGRSPSELYSDLTSRLGAPAYARMDAPATPAQKQRLGALRSEDVVASQLAGEAITAVYNAAPGNNEAIGGVKVITENAWFAARPSGTEDVYKIYAESFLGEDHLRKVQAEASALVGRTLAS